MLTRDDRIERYLQYLTKTEATGQLPDGIREITELLVKNEIVTYTEFYDFIIQKNKTADYRKLRILYVRLRNRGVSGYIPHILFAFDDVCEASFPIKSIFYEAIDTNSQESISLMFEHYAPVFLFIAEQTNIRLEELGIFGKINSIVSEILYSFDYCVHNFRLNLAFPAEVPHTHSLFCFLLEQIKSNVSIAHPELHNLDSMINELTRIDFQAFTYRKDFSKELKLALSAKDYYIFTSIYTPGTSTFGTLKFCKKIKMNCETLKISINRIFNILLANENLQEFIKFIKSGYLCKIYKLHLNLKFSEAETEMLNSNFEYSKLFSQPDKLYLNKILDIKFDPEEKQNLLFNIQNNSSYAENDLFHTFLGYAFAGERIYKNDIIYLNLKLTQIRNILKQ